jgi:hypothetical protein
MNNEELAKQITDMADSFLWTTAPKPKSEPPPNATLTSYVGNGPKIAVIVCYWTENDKSGYSAMATVTTGSGIIAVTLNSEQAKICFDTAKVRST